ncbi:hypothetical protein [Candidatus Chlorobium masyuteum]|uniref:hypothetical protein n=1 Tax=Candidatus Chlorobium masyuteum TaxID=2716876 RepID=UPI002E2DE47B|nr:hypothetical protein [Candidatus Chlorobium masyuteum]
MDKKFLHGSRDPAGLLAFLIRYLPLSDVGSDLAMSRFRQLHSGYGDAEESNTQ